MKAKFKIITFCLLSSSFISCDQVTKKLAKDNLMYQGPTSYLNDLFRLEYAENTGAALSLGADLPQPFNFILLSIIPLVFMLAVLAYVIIKMKDFSLLRLTAFALVFAGGIGNLIDRIFRDRHVTDFMNLGIHHIRTGIFNVADVCITAGVIVLFISYNKEQQLDAKGTRLT
ncbi:signal peptidase II [Mucilaginibacter sp. PAMB04274]|uniref:signal peptidase II n=1 Tax=Mucilaginibacter sp. PAMB04274 TaxID=3138568 RepID=UPI0031F60FE7